MSGSGPVADDVVERVQRVAERDRQFAGEVAADDRPTDLEQHCIGDGWVESCPDGPSALAVDQRGADEVGHSFSLELSGEGGSAVVE